MLDERLRTELRRAAPTADVDGVFERVETKQRRRRRTSRAKQVALVIAVLALTSVGVVGLHEIFRVAPTARPAAAPDPGVIVFVDGQDAGSLGIYTLSPTEGGVRRIGAGIDPALSPDGTRVAFLQPLGRDRFAIATMNLDGSGVEPLRSLPAIASPVLFMQQGGPAWSPDGMKLLFVSAPFGSRASTNMVDLYEMNADGSGVRRLTTNGDSWAPAWAPDGKEIAFIRNGEVWTMNADGSQQASLSHGLRWAERPSWSPDERRIAVANDTDLVLLRVDGSRVTTLVHTHSILRAPAWAPDGSTIAYVGCTIHWSDCGIREVDTDTGAASSLGTPISAYAASRSGLGWGPSSDTTEGRTP
jgi:Tol biopolymer transport system component